MAVAIVARGAASSLGVGAAAFDVGGLDEPPRTAWSARVPDKYFARVTACAAPRPARPRALLELGLSQVAQELSLQLPSWRQLRVGVVLGTSSGGLPALESVVAATLGGTATPAGWEDCAYFAPLSGVEAALGRKPDRLVALYGACASSALAWGLGKRWLELALFDLVLAGGYDAESDWVCAGFDSLKATSAGLPRPFRVERDGMALGEGVAIAALARHAARAHGFVQGFGASTDAVHITAPDRTGQGLSRAAERALADAELTAQDIQLVSAHGTGTSFNDASEAAALSRVLGAGAAKPVLHAFKPAVGHTLGAASALEALAALAALERGVLPATAGSGTPLPELPARLLERNQAAPATSRCLKLATAFGGANAALVLAREAAPATARVARAAHLAACGAPVSTALDPELGSPQLVAPPERLPRSDRLSSLAVAAAASLLETAARSGLRLERSRTGVLVGSVCATLEADREFAERVLSRGRKHAEPRRFPATSPNACAGHVAIAFGLGGLSHAVGAGPHAALEALEVARDWVAAGDVDAMVVVAAEHTGATSLSALSALGLALPESGALAVLVVAQPGGLLLDAALVERVRASALAPESAGFRGLEAACRAAGLPVPGAFGSVRAPAPE